MSFRPGDAFLTCTLFCSFGLAAGFQLRGAWGFTELVWQGEYDERITPGNGRGGNGGQDCLFSDRMKLTVPHPIARLNTRKVINGTEEVP